MIMLPGKQELKAHFVCTVGMFYNVDHDPIIKTDFKQPQMKFS